MSDLTEIIERLEKASKGSRYLDADIYEALGFRVKREPQNWNNIAWKYGKRDARGQLRCWYGMERLTTSLDAAESLWASADPLPKRKPYRALQYWNDYLPGGNAIWRVKALESNGNMTFEVAIGQHKSKRIAACIAALKAQEASNASD